MKKTTNIVKNPYNWDNSLNNTQFYEVEKIQAILSNYAQRGGLQAGEDLDVIYNDIKDSSALLDVGAGYGRIIEQLLLRRYNGKIYAVEQSHIFCETLRKQFGNQIMLYEGNILTYQPSEKFPTILCLWSILTDFTPPEQIEFIQYLRDLLTQDGKIYLDTTIHNQQPANATSLQQQEYAIEELDGKLRGYIPSPEEVEAYCQQSGMRLEKMIRYQTSTQRLRIMYVLTH